MIKPVAATEPPVGDGLVVCGGVLLAIASAALMLIQTELKWQAALAVSALLLMTIALSALSTDPWKFILKVFLLCLSLNINYFITQPRESLYIGSSSAGAFFVELSFLLACVVLGRQAFMSFLGGGRFLWGAPVGGPALLMLAAAAISAAQSSVRLFGVFVLFETFQHYVTFLAIVNAVRTRKDVEAVAKTFLFVLVFQFVVSLVQVGSGMQQRATGTVSSVPSGLATFLEPLVFMALALALPRVKGDLEDRFGRIAPALAAVLGVITIAITKNRSSWSGLPIGFLAVGLLAGRRYRFRTAVLAVVGMLVLPVAAYPLLQSRLATIEEDWQVRMELVGPALSMIKDNPVVGVGPGGYGYSVRRYAGKFNGWLFFVHNEYLLIWAERGTLGVLTWLVWLGAGMRQIGRARRTAPEPLRSMAAGWQAGMIVVLWELLWNSYEPFLSTTIVWSVFALAVAINTISAGTTTAGITLPAALTKSGQSRRGPLADPRLAHA